MTPPLLKKLLSADTIGMTRKAVSRTTLAEAEAIIATVRRRGRDALVEMLASLKDNTLELKSNVSGKFVP